MSSLPDPETPGVAFEVVRRGYARDQVDAHLREVERRLRAAENARRMAEQHAATMAEELRTLRESTPAHGTAAQPASMFGFRVEKVLRLAERDATEIRARAAREAAALLEQAHAAAAEARTDADQERAAAAQLRRDTDLRTQEVSAAVAQLTHLRGSVRAELARLHALLGAELQGLTDDEEPAGIEAADPTADVFAEAADWNGSIAQAAAAAGTQTAAAAGTRTSAAAGSVEGAAQAADVGAPPDGGAAGSGAGAAQVTGVDAAPDGCATAAGAAAPDRPEGAAAPGAAGMGVAVGEPAAGGLAIGSPGNAASEPARATAPEASPTVASEAAVAVAAGTSATRAPGPSPAAVPEPTPAVAPPLPGTGGEAAPAETAQGRAPGLAAEGSSRAVPPLPVRVPRARRAVEDVATPAVPARDGGDTARSADARAVEDAGPSLLGAAGATREIGTPNGVWTPTPGTADLFDERYAHRSEDAVADDPGPGAARAFRPEESPARS